MNINRTGTVCLVVLALLFFPNCQHQNSTEQAVSGTKDTIGSPHEVDSPHFISVDGIWRCTPETSLKFPHGILEPVIMIKGSYGGNLTVQGCFLWEGRYHDTWELSKVRYNGSTGELTFSDRDGDSYLGSFRKDMQTIFGNIYAGDPSQAELIERLDFRRASADLATRLFIPRLPDTDGSMTYEYLTPERTNDGLQTASVSSYLQDTTAFHELMAKVIRQEFGRMESLLILKDQQLVVEEYFYGFDRTKLHNIHSCTKSVTSLLMGIALEHQEEANIHTPIFDLLPGYNSLKNEAKEQITLKHLLTMTAGFQDHYSDTLTSSDQLGEILQLSLESEPGENFRYNNDCSILLGGIIHALEGKHADKLAEEYLFGPLGINGYVWEAENGLPQCHSDLHLIPRDMAKLGLLVLQNGKWMDEQIVPEAWIMESTKPHVPESEYFDYGYHWWHRSNNNRPWWKDPHSDAHGEHNMVVALGFGGQYIMIIRDLNLVVVTTASDYTNGQQARSKVPMVIEEIVPLFTKK